MGWVTALSLVKTLEGGKVDNPDDPGGRTKDGVTQSTFNSMGFKGDVFDATDEQIAAAYYRMWMRVKVTDPMSREVRSIFGILPEPADAMAFQMYVNIPSHFARLMQHAAKVEEDGILGPETMRALDNLTPMTLAEAIADAQMNWYANVRPHDEFTTGLVNRVLKARKILGV